MPTFTMVKTLKEWFWQLWVYGACWRTLHITSCTIGTRSRPETDAPLDGNSSTTFISINRCIDFWSRFIRQALQGQCGTDRMLQGGQADEAQEELSSRRHGHGRIRLLQPEYGLRHVLSQAQDGLAWGGQHGSRHLTYLNTRAWKQPTHSDPASGTPAAIGSQPRPKPRPGLPGSALGNIPPILRGKTLLIHYSVGPDETCK